MDGSEDHLVSSRLKSLVGKEFGEWRAELLKQTPAETLKDLMSSITPPEGVHRREHSGARDLNYVLPDEGRELYDCDGDELEPVESEVRFSCC